jgi:hypothetical protein
MTLLHTSRILLESLPSLSSDRGMLALGGRLVVMTAQADMRHHLTLSANASLLYVSFTFFGETRANLYHRTLLCLPSRDSGGGRTGKRDEKGLFGLCLCHSGVMGGSEPITNLPSF